MDSIYLILLNPCIISDKYPPKHGTRSQKLFQLCEDVYTRQVVPIYTFINRISNMNWSFTVISYFYLFFKNKWLLLSMPRTAPQPCSILGQSQSHFPTCPTCSSWFEAVQFPCHWVANSKRGRPCATWSLPSVCGVLEGPHPSARAWPSGTTCCTQCFPHLEKKQSVIKAWNPSTFFLSLTNDNHIAFCRYFMHRNETLRC